MNEGEIGAEVMGDTLSFIPPAVVEQACPIRGARVRWMEMILVLHFSAGE